MKKIFLIIAIVIFSFASAQNTTDTFWVKPIEPSPKDYSLQLPKTYLINPPQQLIDKSRLLNTSLNGNKVYALPQDNMPCIVPDMSQYNTPTLKPDIPLYTIPNPAFPPPAKPGIITQEQLDKLLRKYKKQDEQRSER